MKNHTHYCDIQLTPFDNKRLLSLCGKFNEHIRQIESRFQVEILHRGNTFQVTGDPQASATAGKVIKSLYQQTNNGTELTPEQVHLSIQEFSANANQRTQENNAVTMDEVKLKTPELIVNPRTPHQVEYVKKILQHAINFGIGPAGTGKTFLAVACAVSLLEQKKINRILLVRPVVEAGERLGFLPGDLTQKIDPYLRPLYDALYEMLGADKVSTLLQHQVIEIAPLAYMRGRTLNDAFIILDEGQNTTIEQMKMFLTRIGFSSTAVITGDITQVDLPRGKGSGLVHANNILHDLQDISFTYFDSTDVIRHPVVQQIIQAYNKAENKANYDAKNNYRTNAESNNKDKDEDRHT